MFTRTTGTASRRMPPRLLHMACSFENLFRFPSRKPLEEVDCDEGEYEQPEEIPEIDTLVGVRKISGREIHIERKESGEVRSKIEANKVSRKITMEHYIIIDVHRQHKEQTEDERNYQPHQSVPTELRSTPFCQRRIDRDA